jgi:uncharacterized protein (DUF4415 family)
MKTPKEFLGIRIDEPVKTWLQETASKRRTTLSEVLRQIVYEAFNAARSKEKR